MSATPLSKRQKAVLSQVARQAWDSLPLDTRWAIYQDLAAQTDDPTFSWNKAFTLWRRIEQKKATGESSLTRMNQHDYNVVKLHFELLAGSAEIGLDAHLTPAAARTLGKLATDEHRTARHKLDKALAERGLAKSYAASICRIQFRCSLEDASTKQLWNLFYTVRNRRKATSQPPH